MKRFICLFLVLITISIFYGCNQLKNAEPELDINSLEYIGNLSLKEKFDNVITVEGALDDMSNVNINMKMGSTSGLGKRTEGKVEYYYKDSDLLYAVYKDDEDNRWDYFTMSKSGAELDVVFWREGSTKFVKVAAEDYDVVYEDGKLLRVTVKNNDEYATYSFAGQKYYISDANHITSTGEMYEYLAEYNVDTGKIENETDERAR